MLTEFEKSIRQSSAFEEQALAQGGINQANKVMLKTRSTYKPENVNSMRKKQSGRTKCFFNLSFLIQL